MGEGGGSDYYYDGHPVILIDKEDPELLCQKDVLSYVYQIENALEMDDSEEFVEVLMHERNVGTVRKAGYVISPSIILRWTIQCRALRCAKSLLLEPVVNGCLVDVDAAPSLDGLSLIHMAATEFLPDFVQLLLIYGARLDIPCYNHLSNYYMMLPLDAALTALRKKILWTPDQSVYGFIFSLCKNKELEQAFNAISRIMLAGPVEQSREAIYRFVREGKIVELTALLYVDAISGLRILQELSHDEYLALLRCVPTVIASLSEQELYSAVDSNGVVVSMDKQRLMMFVVMLLEIFYRTKFLMLGFSSGHEILEKSIKEAGFDLTTGDLQNLCDVHAATKVVKDLKTMDDLPQALADITQIGFLRSYREHCYHGKYGILSAAQTFKGPERCKSRLMSTLCPRMDAQARVVKATHDGQHFLSSSLEKKLPVFASAIRRIK